MITEGHVGGFIIGLAFVVLMYVMYRAGVFGKTKDTNTQPDGKDESLKGFKRDAFYTIDYVDSRTNKKLWGLDYATYGMRQIPPEIAQIGSKLKLELGGKVLIEGLVKDIKFIHTAVYTDEAKGLVDTKYRCLLFIESDEPEQKSIDGTEDNES